MVTIFGMMINRHVFLKQTDGYFDNEKFLLQVDKAIDIFEAKYTSYQGLFIFDNVPSHKRCPDDALKVENMNVRPGSSR